MAYEIEDYRNELVEPSYSLCEYKLLHALRKILNNSPIPFHTVLCITAVYRLIKLFFSFFRALFRIWLYGLTLHQMFLSTIVSNLSVSEFYSLKLYQWNMAKYKPPGCTRPTPFRTFWYRKLYFQLCFASFESRSWSLCSLYRLRIVLQRKTFMLRS